MNINRKKLIEFYDIKIKENSRHISGITGLIGESLTQGLLLHKLKNDGFEAKVLPQIPTIGQKRGKRLDCWITAQRNGERRLYQVEIKNWSAYSKGGEDLPLNADKNEQRNFSIKKWQSIFQEESIKNEYAQKVLIRMNPPKDFSDWNHRALACFWFCLHPQGTLESLFLVRTRGAFSQIEMFSMSAYLRKLSEETIQLELKWVVERLNLIKALGIT